MPHDSKHTTRKKYELTTEKNKIYFLLISSDLSIIETLELETKFTFCL